MLGISLWTPDKVYAYTEYIRSTSEKKYLLRLYGPLPNFRRPLSSCQPVE